LFENIYRRNRTIQQQMSAAFAESRSRYLEHLTAQGYARASLREVAREICGVAERLDPSSEKVNRTTIEAIVDEWMQAEKRTSRGVRIRIINGAISWLRFSGMLDEKPSWMPFSRNIERFTRYMQDERGLAAATIYSNLKTIDSFLSWFAEEKPALSDANIVDIDRYLACKGREVWKRRTVARVAQTLRLFFGYAEQSGWCSPGIATGIDIPRIYGHENVPLGPSWEQVRALIATTDTVTPRNLRDRACLLLFAVYGLRCSEVRQLRLDDIDWQHDRLTVKRAKSRRTQEFPLTQEVGNAIIRYIREVRPRCAYREIFLALKAPWRPITAAQFYYGIRERIDALGIKLVHRGPHALRHACATHLMTEGLSLKEIGDHLGHNCADSTRIYAKVDIAGLREVAEFSLGGLQ
jgi:integrase/recombinase XerD